MLRNDGYSVIIERPSPYEMSREAISTDAFDELCKKSQNVTVDYCIINDKEKNNGFD